MIYSVDYTVTWLGYFSTLSTFLVRKSFKGSFWDSYLSKNCQRLICQGHFDAFDVSFKILNHPEMSSNGLERFWKGQKLLQIKTFLKLRNCTQNFPSHLEILRQIDQKKMWNLVRQYGFFLTEGFEFFYGWAVFKLKVIDRLNFSQFQNFHLEA